MDTVASLWVFLTPPVYRLCDLVPRNRLPEPKVARSYIRSARIHAHEIEAAGDDELHGAHEAEAECLLLRT